jgi:putative ABC transport system permease protein
MTADIRYFDLALGYTLLIIPFAIILWYRIPIFSETLVAIARMTVQLLFVGLYLQIVFQLNNAWLNGAWVLVMIIVADVSIVRGTDLRASVFLRPMFFALLMGTAMPLFFFMGVILRRPELLEAQYVIPIGGMILGNCLRADIIGLKTFYGAIHKSEKAYLQTLANGARLSEAIRPFIRDACQAALVPTVATMATIGLVSLPGMMTGVILGGADPTTAIKYQMAIMIAIFSGTTITVILGIWLTLKSSFTAYGILNHQIFKPAK